MTEIEWECVRHAGKIMMSETNRFRENLQIL